MSMRKLALEGLAMHLDSVHPSWCGFEATDDGKSVVLESENGTPAIEITPQEEENEADIVYERDGLRIEYSARLGTEAIYKAMLDIEQAFHAFWEPR